MPNTCSGSVVFLAGRSVSSRNHQSDRGGIMLGGVGSEIKVCVCEREEGGGRLCEHSGIVGSSLTGFLPLPGYKQRSSSLGLRPLHMSQ